MDREKETISIRGRLRSFRHAFGGIADLLVTQHNAWIHALATVCVIVVGLSSGVSAIEWCVLILAMMVVWVAEALNTAIEYLCDVASPDFHPLVKKSKDIAAGGVLLSAIGAAVLGFIILLPRLLDIL